jgi:hypothetical protein
MPSRLWRTLQRRRSVNFSSTREVGPILPSDELHSATQLSELRAPGMRPIGRSEDSRLSAHSRCLSAQRVRPPGFGCQARGSKGGQGASGLPEPRAASGFGNLCLWALGGALSRGGVGTKGRGSSWISTHRRHWKRSRRPGWGYQLLLLGIRGRKGSGAAATEDSRGRGVRAHPGDRRDRCLLGRNSARLGDSEPLRLAGGWADGLTGGHREGSDPDNRQGVSPCPLSLSPTDHGGGISTG